MSGPFDFLQNIGSDISQGEQSVQNTVGGWLKGLLPSQPAQPKTPPLQAPTLNASPLGGMSPNVGVAFPGQNQPNLLSNLGGPARQGLDQLGQNIGTFAQNTGINQLGNDFMTKLDNVGSQLGAARDLAGQDLAGDIQNKTGMSYNQSRQLAKIPTDPMGYIMDVLNAGIVAPGQLAANPEMWFTPDTTQSKDAGFGGNVGMGGPGHNYLNDMFRPLVKSLTGEDVPDPTTAYEGRAKALMAQQQQLVQAQQQLEGNPNASQSDINAFNAKLSEYNAQYSQYMSNYQKSADWWQNSQTAKTMGILGQIATAPEGFAAGMLEFVPSLLESPVGTAEGMIGQVKQGVDFIGAIQDGSWGKMSAQEQAANVSNIISLGGMLLGAKGILHRDSKPGQDVLDPASRAEVIKGLQDHTPSISNPKEGQVANAAAIADSREASPVKEDPQSVQVRIQDLVSSLNIAQRQLHNETDPTMKRALVEQVSGLTDEISNLRGIPRQPEDLNLPERGYSEGGTDVPPAGYGESLPLDLTQWSLEDLSAEANSLSDEYELSHDPTVLDRMLEMEDEINHRMESDAGEKFAGDSVPAGREEIRAAQQRARIASTQDAVNASGREKFGEQGPSKTYPEVKPISTYPDYMGETDKVLGPNYQFLEPRPEDFSLNVKPPTRGEQIGIENQGQAGQAGTPNTAGEIGNRPEGIPEGARLTATIPSGVEGQAPVSVWETGTQPAGPISTGSGAAQLAAARTDFNNAVTEALSQVEDTQLRKVLWEGLKPEIDKLSSEDINKFIEERNQQWQNTFERVRGKYDPEGYIQNLFFDHQSKADAYFVPDRPRAITYNPLKLLRATWANIIGDNVNSRVRALEGVLSPDQYKAASDWVRQWAFATQEELDENTIAEEIAHGYDYDHYLTLADYIRSISKNYDWMRTAYDAGLGGSEHVPFNDSVLGWAAKILEDPDSVPQSRKDYVFENLVEYRASLLKVYLKAPLAGYSFRAPEVFINELKDPSLIARAARAIGQDFETRLRPAVKTWIASQTPRPVQISAAVSQEGRFAGTSPTDPGTTPTGSSAVLSGVTPTPTSGIPGRNAGDQGSLNAKQPPSEKKGFMSIEEFQSMQRMVTDEAIGDLTKAGWPEGQRWENFARALMNPNTRAYEHAAAIWDKMPPKSASIFMKAGEMLARETIKTGEVPAEEAEPERSKLTTPQEIVGPQNQFFQKEIAAARVKLQESGPVIDKMVASGESLKEINTAKAQQVDLRSYIDALENGKPPKEAAQIARQAYTAELNRLNAATKVHSPVPELEEEPYKGVFLGKKYGNFNVDIAKQIIQRLRWGGYDGLQIDRAGNINFGEFLDGLFAEDRIAEKAYKALPLTFRDYINSKVGYNGVPKRGKGMKSQETTTISGIAPGTENYINQTDFEGLERAIAVVPQKGGFIAIRHGSTARNGGAGSAERLRGWDDIPLNDQGEQHAERLGAAFKGVPVSIIYASPMKRSLDTANAIAKTTGAKVVIDDNLKPWNIGDWSGKPASEYGKMIAEYAQTRPNEKIPGGESFNDYARRYLPAVKKHMNDALAQDGITLEVNHTRGVRMIKGHVMGGGQGEDFNMDAVTTKDEVGPGGIMGLKFENGRWQVAGDTLTNKLTDAKQFVSGEASQKFDLSQESQKPANKPAIFTAKEDSVVSEIKQNIKEVQKNENKAAKIKGELKPRIDLASQIDAAAADPSHPANASAVEAKTLRDLLPRAQELGGAAYERIKSDYAIALQRFTSRMAQTSKDRPAAAEIITPNVPSSKTFEHTATIAAQLRKKIDKGADLNDVAEEAAKKLGMTLKQALGKMKDEKMGANIEAKSWSPAYRDLLLGKFGQVVREAKLSNRKLNPVIPIDSDLIMGSGGEYKPTKSTQPVKPRKPVTTPAVANILRRSTQKHVTHKETPGDQVHRETTAKADKAQVEHGKKSTKTLRDEVEQIHKEINTPSPNPFGQSDQYRRIVQDMAALRKERRKAGLEEPGMVSGGSGDGGDESPPKGPGNVLAGWGDSYEPARSYPELKSVADRMDVFVKRLAERVNPGRNQGHPIAQARQYIEASVGDRYRRDGILKDMEKFLGTDIERHRRIRRAIEGPEAARLAAKKLLDPEEAAFADMWHGYEAVVGRIKTSADRELMKASVEDHLAHILKFNEQGEAILDKKGNTRAQGIGSGRFKSWVHRSVDEETGEVRFPTIDTLIKEFGEGSVEENLPKIFKASTSAFINKMRVKELIDDLSGHYISNDESFKLGPGMFREKDIFNSRGLRKGDPPYIGRAIVPEGKGYEQMEQEYKDQLRRINLGPYKTQLRSYYVYKPLAEQLERYAAADEGLEGYNKATNWLAKANSVYKLYKFGFNPIHLFNLLTNMDAMGGKYNPIPNFSLYPKVFGRVDKLLTGEGTWTTPIGDFNGDEAIAKVIDAGAVVRDQLIDTANLGGLQGVLANHVPLFKWWHNFMWHGVAWKGQIGLSMHLTDVISQQFENHFKRPPNEAEFDNILHIAVQNSKYAMGFLDRGDMTRDWRLIGNSAYFANSWSTVQLRLFGKAFSAAHVPGANWLSNLGGGEKYVNTITPMMKDLGGMTPDGLKWINTQDGTLAKQYAIGGSLKLLATSIALGYAGSTLAVLTGQQNAQISGPWNNFMRDPLRTFDIYLGTDPTTGKDKWQHNPLYGMIQEMMLYGMSAVKAANNGGDPYNVIATPALRYGFGKANPVATVLVDLLAQRELSLFYQGYGNRSDITQDPSIVAIQKALTAKGIDFPTGLMDNLIYAWRSIGPSPSFAPTIHPSEQVSTWGDISNAMGTGQFFGIGDFMNALDSTSPQFGNMSNVGKFDLGNLAQYVTGSRQTLTATPAQVLQNNQIAQSTSDNATKQQAEQQMAQAAYKGDWKTVLAISSQLNMDNNQMLNALEHPPAGSGGGIIYHGLPYQPSDPTQVQDTLQGYTLTKAQSADLESIKKMTTIAFYNELTGTPLWQNSDGTERSAMISSMETQVMRAVDNQYAQQVGIMGGTPITNDDIQSLITAQIDMRSIASGIVATNQTYINSDPIQQQRMRTEYAALAGTLAWDATFGALKGVPPENIQKILDATINTEEGTRTYLKGSIFYQMALPQDQARMLTEYSSLARTMAKRYALEQGQGPRGDIQLNPEQLMPIIQQTITVEETAKSLLHGTDYYQVADQSVQTSLDDKYARLSRSLAFSQGPYGNPMDIINSSIMSEESYFDLQNQFGGGNYVKLMAQQLSDLELTFRQGADYTPKQISAMQRAIRAGFLAKNPAYAQYLRAKTWWGRNTSDGQIYSAINNSEYAAVDDLAQQDVQAPDSVLLSGTSTDPYFDPASNMGLVDMGLGALSTPGLSSSQTSLGDPTTGSTLSAG